MFQLNFKHRSIFYYLSPYEHSQSLRPLIHDEIHLKKEKDLLYIEAIIEGY